MMPFRLIARFISPTRPRRLSDTGFAAHDIRRRRRTQTGVTPPAVFQPPSSLPPAPDFRRRLLFSAAAASRRQLPLMVFAYAAFSEIFIEPPMPPPLPSPVFFAFADADIFDAAFSADAHTRLMR
jgi:hypothetical protein